MIANSKANKIDPNPDAVRFTRKASNATEHAGMLPIPRPGSSKYPEQRKNLAQAHTEAETAHRIAAQVNQSAVSGRSKKADALYTEAYHAHQEAADAHKGVARKYGG